MAYTSPMRTASHPEDVSLLAVLIDGFEKNEVLNGFHRRDLPMPDEAAALRKFEAFAQEARRWKGPPTREALAGPRRLVAWPDLQVRQLGRGVMVLVRAPWFSDWWNQPGVWAGDPMGPLFDWLDEEP